MQGHLLGHICVVANEKRHPKCVSGCYLGLGRIEIAQLLNIVRWPEGAVEGPRSAEFQPESRRWGSVATRLGVGDWARCDALEDIARSRSAHERFSEDESDRHLGEFLQLCVGEIVLRLVTAPSLSRDSRIGYFARRRCLGGLIFGALSMKKIEMSRV